MLTEKEKKIIERYASDLAMPKWKYVLINGGIFSILLIIFNWIYDFLVNRKLINEIFSYKLWQYLIIIPVVTIGYGMMLHWIISRHYRKLKDKQLAG